jgi:hypothetical protein
MVLEALISNKKCSDVYALARGRKMLFGMLDKLYGF